MTLDEFKEKINNALTQYEDGDNEVGHACEDDILIAFINMVVDEEILSDRTMEIFREIKVLLNTDRTKWYA